MDYQLRLNPAAEKQLNKLPEKEYYKVLETLAAIANNPFLGKKLKGKHKDQWSARVWPYRIIYSIYKNQLLVIVIEIGHRQGIY